jgi:type I restriction enzyme M protein
VLFFDNRPASKTPWTKEVWIYDYRTNVKHTLKADPMKYEDLQDFIACYNPADRHKRKETWPVSPSASSGPVGPSVAEDQGRWRKFTYDEILARDKASLDIFWLKDDSMEDMANLPEPGVLAAEIVEDLEAALEQFRLIADDLGE